MKKILNQALTLLLLAPALVFADSSVTTPNPRLNSDQVHADLAGFVQSGARAVTRTLVDKSREVVSVADFGAQPDDGIDDTAAINAALASGAKKVNFAAGVYKIAAGSLIIPNGVSVIGAGENKTVLDGSAATFASLIKGAHLTTTAATLTALPALTVSPNKNDGTLTFASAPSVTAGDVLTIYNPTDSSWSGFRKYYRAGERVRVASVSGNVVTLQGTLFDSYSAGVVTVYRNTGMNTLEIADLTVKGLSSTKGDQTTYGIILQDCVDSSIRNVRSVNASYAAIEVKGCFNVSLNSVDAEEDFISAFGGDYGLMIANSQGVSVVGGYFYASRIGIAIGGGSSVGDVPNRLINVSGAAIGSKLQAADVHGNSEYVTYANNVMDGGIDFGGDHINIVNNTIRGKQYNGGAILGSEFRGGNHYIVGNDIENDQVAASRGALIDIGGNSNVITSSTVHGGNIVIKGNRLKWNIATDANNNYIQVTNRGYSLAEPLNVFITDNVLTTSGGRFSYAGITIDSATAVPFNIVDFSNNSISNAGGAYVTNSTAGRYSAKQVIINNNKIDNSNQYSQLVSNVQDLIAYKNNVTTNANYGTILNGQSGYPVGMIHAMGNTFAGNMRAESGSSATDSDLILWNATTVINNDNVVGSLNEVLPVASAAGFVVGETITGATSAATAKVKAVVGATRIMIERTRSGTFVTEKIRGGTSGTVTAATAAVYAQKSRFSYLNDASVYQGGFVNTNSGVHVDYSSGVSSIGGI